MPLVVIMFRWMQKKKKAIQRVFTIYKKIRKLWLDCKW